MLSFICLKGFLVRPFKTPFEWCLCVSCVWIKFSSHKLFFLCIFDQIKHFRSCRGGRRVGEGRGGGMVGKEGGKEGGQGREGRREGREGYHQGRFWVVGGQPFYIFNKKKTESFTQMNFIIKLHTFGNSPSPRFFFYFSVFFWLLTQKYTFGLFVAIGHSNFEFKEASQVLLNITKTRPEPGNGWENDYKFRWPDWRTDGLTNGRKKGPIFKRICFTM